MIVAWPPGMELSMVLGTRSMMMAGSGRSTRNMQAPSSDLAMMIPTLAPTAPVMKHLRPLMTQWLPSSLAVVCIIEGSEPAPPSSAGSVMKKAERASPETSCFRKRSFNSGLPTLPMRYMLPSSGAMVFTATGPSGDRPEGLRTIAVSRCVRWRPSGRMCGVITPAARAFSRSSSTSSSVGPWLVARGSCS